MTSKNSNRRPSRGPAAARLATSAFDYELPEELIASEPAPRGASRLFVVDETGERRHRNIADLPELLAEGDLLVLNNTRVLPARLFGRRQPSGGRVEILLVERQDERRWTALLRPAARLRAGDAVALPEELLATLAASPRDGMAELIFSRPLDDVLERIGHVPLPPYIRRPDTATDRERYQTVYARVPGAIAAPTAGLHFDHEILARLESRGIARAELTLHVGLGTFRPVKATWIDEHRMETERYTLSPELCASVATTRRQGGRVVAVGTTVVRALESAARQASGDQLSPGDGRTDLFIRPGFDFRVVDLLLTNFHLPRSTLLMLVAAFAGTERILTAYAEAIARRYRFYSYGDAMLVARASAPPER